MPAKYENLKNPPAIEAVFDIAVQENDAADTNFFIAEDAAIKQRFPVREELKVFEGAFQIGGTMATQATNRPLGYLYRTDDGKELIQLRLNGYSYNKLAPYNGWSNFLNAALTYWEQYRMMKSDLKITRIGLRFINVLNIPMSLQKKKLFNVSLKKPSKSNLGSMSDVSYRYTTEFSDFGCKANVQFGKLNPNAAQASYLLDIDVYNTDIASSPDAKTMKHHFSKLRDAKNAIFFSTLTDEALEVFK